MNTFTGNKDVDREILLNLPDKKLIQTCSLNTYLLETVCDDNFFYRKLQLTYPDTLSLWDPKEYKNYKQFYLEMVIYVAKMKEEYGYIYVGGDPMQQFEILSLSEYSGPSIKKKIVPQKLLSRSAEKGELILAKYAVSKGAVSYYNNEYALRAASEYGHLEIVKYLVSLGVNIHINLEAPLITAIIYGHLQVVKYLVSLGADVHINNNIAFTQARVRKHIDILEYLESLN